MAELKAATRDELLRALAYYPVREVPLPEAGLKLWVRTLSAGELDGFRKSLRKLGKDGRIEPTDQNGKARFAALCACDQQGKRLFTDDDSFELARLSAPLVERISDAAEELNAQSPGAQEEMEKNS